MQRHLLGWLLLSALLPGTAFVFGCGVQGDRASTGECPDDEICSDATPAGLIFEGTRVSGTFIGGGSIAPVAVGGTQRVSIRTADHRALPTFEAVTSTTGIEVEGVVGTTIEVRGTASGSAMLRVLERDGGGLLDRTTIEARPIANAVVAPSADLAIALADVVRATVYEPGEHTIAVHLVDASGRIVIDEGMTIDAGVPATVASWDTLTVNIPATGLDLAVEAGDGAFTARAEVAGTIDDIELATWLMAEGVGGARELAAGSSVCALALSSNAWVVSATPSTARFTLGDTVLVTDDDNLTTHCARIPVGTPEGAAELTIEIAGVSRTFTISITRGSEAASSSLVSGGRVDIRTSSRALGERARSMLTY